MPFLPTNGAAPHEAENILQQILQATEAGDYGAFLAPGTPSFRKGISRAMFDSVSRQEASRLKAGHTAHYLTELNQGEFRVYLC